MDVKSDIHLVSSLVLLLADCWDNLMVGLMVAILESDLDYWTVELLVLSKVDMIQDNWLV